jgi:hypothetical protein
LRRDRPSKSFQVFRRNDDMAVQRIRRVDVINNRVIDEVPKISRQQRRFMEGRVRKIAAVEAVTERISTMHRLVHEQILEETRQGVVQINGHDGWVERLGGDAAATHAIVKDNFYQTQMGLLQELNAETRKAHEELLDEIAALPDAFWYDRSFKDRFVAWAEGVNLELEDRGLPQLTFREALKELLTGDVVTDKTAAFDQAQSAQRQRLRAEIRELAAAQAMALGAGEASAAQLPATVLTSEEREARPPLNCPRPC